MKTNPYTGQPLPENQYAPTIIKPLANVGNTQFSTSLKTNGVSVPVGDRVSNIGDSAKSKPNIGSKVLSNMDGIASFGIEQYSNFQNTAASTKESQGQIVSSTLKGAALGLQIGGPWGAAIGAVGGAALGFIDMKGDQKKRSTAEDKQYREALEIQKNQRKEAYLMQKGKQASQIQGGMYGDEQTYYNPYG
jgi:hypothetical protein